MAQSGKFSNEGSEPKSTNQPVNRPNEQTQADFELDFFAGVLTRNPEFVEVLRALGHILTTKNRYAEGLEIDKRLVRLRPQDALAHYNLACSFALLKRSNNALQALRRAVELGYRDFRYMKQDHDLDSIRHDPRFRQILREYDHR
jgi:Flp pilus assembly protein TadD